MFLFFFIFIFFSYTSEFKFKKKNEEEKNDIFSANYHPIRAKMDSRSKMEGKKKEEGINHTLIIRVCKEQRSFSSAHIGGSMRLAYKCTRDPSEHDTTLIRNNTIKCSYASVNEMPVHSIWHWPSILTNDAIAKWLLTHRWMWMWDMYIIKCRSLLFYHLIKIPQTNPIGN